MIGPWRHLATTALVVAALGSVAAKPRKAYEAVYDAHTRHLVVYRGFETALNLRGTLLDGPMRDALTAERKRLLNPSDANHAEFDGRMDRDGAAWHEVVFSADIPVDDLGTFGDTDATWNLRLIADGTEEKLVQVERIRRPSPLHRGLYPHLNLWSELYIARFERTVDAPRSVALLVGSGFGNGRVDWSLPAAVQ